MDLEDLVAARRAASARVAGALACDADQDTVDMLLGEVRAYSRAITAMLDG